MIDVDSKLGDLRVEHYIDVRHKIGNGAMFFEIGHDFAAWWIKWQAKRLGMQNAVSHVGILNWSGPYLMAMEAVLPCSRMVRFSTKIDASDGCTEFIICNLACEEAECRALRIVDAAYKYLGKPYDLEGTTAFAWREAARCIGRNDWENKINYGAGEKKLFCSEYVASCLRAAWIDYRWSDASRVTPTSLLYAGVSAGYLDPLCIISQ